MRVVQVKSFISLSEANSPGLVWVGRLLLSQQSCNWQELIWCPSQSYWEEIRQFTFYLLWKQFKKLRGDSQFANLKYNDFLSWPSGVQGRASISQSPRRPRRERITPCPGCSRSVKEPVSVPPHLRDMEREKFSTATERYGGTSYLEIKEESSLV